MTHTQGDPQTLVKPRDPNETQRVTHTHTHTHTHTQGDSQTLIKPRDPKRNKGGPTHRVTHRHRSRPGTQRETKHNPSQSKPNPKPTQPKANPTQAKSQPNPKPTQPKANPTSALNSQLVPISCVRVARFLFALGHCVVLWTIINYNRL